MRLQAIKGLFLAGLLVLVPGTALGQGVTTASMRGVVTDDAGEPLPGANVIAVHLPSGTEYGTAAGTDGTYNLRNLRVGGPYRVTVTFVGFDDFVREGILLALGETFRLDVRLAESAVELEEVQVVANRGLFDAERTGVGATVDEEQIQRTPTVGRDLADFVRLTPQAYVENDDDDGPAVSIAGQNNRYNAIYIDGAINNDVFGLSAQGTNGGQTGATPISIDAIEEFRINLSPYDVTQSGFTGGSINAITRSGTNRFEGSAYYFLRNESLAGKTPVNLAGDGPRERLPDFSNNRYGFRVGGPIVRNKLFFFVNGEILRSETPQPFEVTYAGNSAGRLGELRQALLAVGYDPGDFGDKASKLDDDKLLVKLDWNISQHHKLSARHSYSHSDNVDAFQSGASAINFSNNAEVFPNTTHSTAVELNSTFGSRFANKLILGYTRVRDDRGFAGDPFPFVQIDDGAGRIFLGSEQFSTANLLEQDIFTVTNTFNWFRGRHTLTFGTHNEFYDIGNLFIPRNFGFYRYRSLDDFLQSLEAVNNPAVDPASPAEFRRGFSLVDGVAGDGSKAIGAFKAFQLGLFVQDEFQVNDRLRVTAGLRADIPKITTKPRFAPDVFDTTIPALEAAGIDLKGAAPGKTPPAAVYLSPRLGFNYDLPGERQAQLRGGIGIFTGRVPFVWPGGMFLNNGTNTGEVRVFTGRLPNGEPIPFVPDVQNALDGEDFGATNLIPSGRLEIFEKDFRYPRVLRTSLGLDYELPGGWVATLEGQYTKTLSNILVTNVNLNPAAIRRLDGPDNRPVYAGDDVAIDPRYTAIHRVGTTSEGYTYDVTAQVQRLFRRLLNDTDQLALNVAYTYGDAWAVNDGTSSQINSLWNSMENVNGLNDLDLTRSDFSIGHRVLASVSYRVEFMNNLGTTFSLFYTGESGRPFSYTIANSQNLRGDGDGFASSLVYVPNSASELAGLSAEDAAALDRFIESSDYLRSRRGTYAERNGSRLPFEHVVDLKIAQELFGNLGGRRQKLEITLDIFNFTNLLNSDWGVRYNGIGNFSLLEFEGFQGEPGSGNFTPVYSLDFDPDLTPTEDALFKTETKDSGLYSSRWFMQLGLRYTF
ncbi:carboxypeptidase regulatory-like domain-containing protein [Rhodocaloribacter litoris]|uniref:TonB-dependent receptor n=1 Tax=Rhodocaloribacter litoris TaxID=2558931 RepID=UPI001E582FBF|nr:TonB-dependent receptor [Rhodocaloribacter litoris]QXD16277.1 carboxypeptidase regulatory-like domain-containing protein [Rhodocaloribacter litoris]